MMCVVYICGWGGREREREERERQRERERERERETHTHTHTHTHRQRQRDQTSIQITFHLLDKAKHSRQYVTVEYIDCSNHKRGTIYFLQALVTL